MSEVRKSAPSPHASRQTEGIWLALLVLLVTAVLAVVWSHNKLMWNDEFLSFYTDSAATVRDVLRIQLHYPISLDPAVYHLLSHFSMDLLGRNAMALRLPAMLGFLLLEFSLFVLVRKLAGAHAALLAMLFPLLTSAFAYAAEGRPYALVLGLHAAALTCWYIASEQGPGAKRTLALLGLAASLALGVNAHFFGILILIPCTVAEFARTYERRAFDQGMLAALGFGFLSVAAVLPFQHAVKPYSQHYYSHHVTLRVIPFGYREMFLLDTIGPRKLQGMITALLLLGVAVVFLYGLRRFVRRPASESLGFWAGLTALALLPVFGFLLGRFVTHTMELRHVLPGLIAFPILLALLVAPHLRARSFAVSFAAMLLLAVAWNAHQIARVHHDSEQTMESFQISPQLAAQLAASPEAKLYLQDMREFYVDSYYLPDAALRSRLALVYDSPREIGWLGNNTYALTAENMTHFAPLDIVPFATFLSRPGPLLITSGASWEWINREMDADHIERVPLGTALRGNAWEIENGVSPRSH